MKKTLKQNSKFYFGLAILSYSFNIHAESPFMKTYENLSGPFNDMGYSVLKTNEGVFVGGSSYSDSNDYITNSWLLMTDEAGNPLWNIMLESSVTGSVLSMAETTDDGVIIGTSEGVFARFDYNGNILWEKKLSSWYMARTNSIIKTTNDDYIAVGTFKQNSSDYFHPFALRFTADGDIIWQNNYSVAIPEDNLAFIFDGLNEVVEADNGEFIISGTRSDSNYPPDTYGWLWRVTSSGNLVWSIAIKGCDARDVEFTNDKDIIITGLDPATVTDHQSVFGKFSQDSSFIGAKAVNATNLYDWSKRIIPLKDGSYVVLGENYKSTASDAWLMKLANDGTFEWKTVIGTSNTADFLEDFVETDYGFLSVGRTNISSSDGSYNLLLASFDENGTIANRIGKTCRYCKEGFDLQTTDINLDIFSLNDGILVNTIAESNWSTVAEMPSTHDVKTTTLCGK